MEAHGLRKTYESEGAPVRALRGVDMTMGCGHPPRKGFATYGRTRCCRACT